MNTFVMTAVLTLIIVLGMTSSSLAQPAPRPQPTPQAQNYFGPFDIVSASSEGMHLFVRAKSLHLNTSGNLAAILLETFFRKWSASVNYTPTPCHAGVQGSCGQVNFVTVDTTGQR